MALPTFVQGAPAKASDMNLVVDAVADAKAKADTIPAVDTKATEAKTLATAAQSAADAAAQAVIDEAAARGVALVNEAAARVNAINTANAAIDAEVAARASADTATLTKAQTELSTEVGILNRAVSDANNVANQALTAVNALQNGGLVLSNIPAYADESSAIAGGVKYEGLYRVGNAIHIVTTAPVVAPPPSDPVAPAPTTPSAPPSGWNLTFTDDFVRSARTGVESLDVAKWGHRSYGGSAHRGSSVWNNGLSHEATGTSVKVHSKKTNGVWYVDGFQQGIQNTDSSAGAYAYHPGYGEFHVRFRARYSHARAPGVGAYALMWQADNVWGSEIDIMESPGEYKTQSQATMHQDFTGEYNLNGKLPDGSDRDKYSSAYKTVDMTQWNIWDCRRTYSLIGGVLHATIRVWINGEEMANAPANWTNTKFLTKPMVFGAASFVAPAELAGWYTVPGANTPTDSWLEIDYVYIWTPDAGAPVSGGDGTTATKKLSLSSVTPTAGTWNVNVLQENLASFTWVVIGPAPNYSWLDAGTTITSPGATTAIAPTFTANGQVLSVWETGNEALKRYSDAVTGFTTTV